MAMREESMSIGIINAGPRRMLGIRGDSHPATPRPRPGNVHLPRGDRNVSARRCPLGRSDLAPAGAGSQGGVSRRLECYRTGIVAPFAMLLSSYYGESHRECAS